MEILVFKIRYIGHSGELCEQEFIRMDSLFDFVKNNALTEFSVKSKTFNTSEKCNSSNYSPVQDAFEK